MKPSQDDLAHQILAVRAGKGAPALPQKQTLPLKAYTCRSTQGLFEFPIPRTSVSIRSRDADHAAGRRPVTSSGVIVFTKLIRDLTAKVLSWGIIASHRLPYPANIVDPSIDVLM